MAKAKENKEAVWEYKKITLEMMMNYIIANAPEDKEWFKSVALIDGKYRHLEARKAFCEKYMPDIIPVAKKKEPLKSELLLNW